MNVAGKTDLGGGVATIIDNDSLSLVAYLEGVLTGAEALDACVGYFNLRGWGHVAPFVDSLSTPPSPERPPARVLVGMAIQPRDQVLAQYRVRSADDDDVVTQGMIPARVEAALADFRDQLAVGLPTDADRATLRLLRDQLYSNRVRVKFYGRRPLHAKLYLALRGDGITSVVGSSNLTFAGLKAQGELNVDTPSPGDVDAKALASWFQDRWDDRFAWDITDDLVQIIDDSWARSEQPDPYLVYLRLAFELSQDAREGLRDWGIPSGLRDILMPYQADAVRVASKILEHRRGVIVGDVVGLGKTLTATAIARLLQETLGYETLIVCPKNLVKMWKDYVREFRLLAEVMSLSVAARDLPELARYRVVVVDESHNLRNPANQAWQALRDYIERNDPLVVLLTATPYNKEYLDVAGQLRLFVDPDEDLLVRPERLIASVGEDALAQKTDGRLSSIRAFEQSTDPEDWQRLMSMFLVRRTRSFVLAQYGEDDPETGKRVLRYADGESFSFPDRVPRPLSYDAPPGDQGELLATSGTVDALAQLELPRYRLIDFVDEAAIGTHADDTSLVDRLRRGRGNLEGFIRTMLMKRMSSSGPAFLLSLERHLLRNYLFLHALENASPLPLGSIAGGAWEQVLPGDGDPEASPLDGGGGAHGRSPSAWAAIAADRYTELEGASPSRLAWARPHLFGQALVEALEHDNAILQGLIDSVGRWDPDADAKLDALARLVAHEHAGEKVLVFSEYADTVKYVAAALADRLPTVAVAGVSADADDPTQFARRFSPDSNEALGGLPRGATELDVLVATDVLSEGQNLQDAAVIVNYDLPWTIIRIIQRAGRVDRVGQVADEVFVYSFLPHDNIDGLINLRERIRTRLRENAQAFGADERFFDAPDETEDILGLFSGNRGAIDDPDEEVDWSSTALAVWEGAPRELQVGAEALPAMASTTRAGRATESAGAIVYTRTSRGLDAIAWAASSGDRPRVLTPLEALSLAECEPTAKAVEEIDDFFVVVDRLVRGPLMEAARRPMTLTHSGPRTKLYAVLSDYLNRVQGTFSDTPELRRLADRVYHQALQETAKHRVVSALRSRTPDEVVALAIDLDDAGDLLVAADRAEEDLRLVLAMGVRS